MPIEKKKVMNTAGLREKRLTIEKLLATDRTD
jgi:hypothetical protein